MQNGAAAVRTAKKDDEYTGVQSVLPDEPSDNLRDKNTLPLIRLTMLRALIAHELSEVRMLVTVSGMGVIQVVPVTDNSMTTELPALDWIMIGVTPVADADPGIRVTGVEG